MFCYYFCFNCLKKKFTDATLQVRALHTNIYLNEMDIYLNEMIYLRKT